ncbi:hypothetical protein EFV37_29345 [Mesorhizobium loti]|uniref:Uncharacterized protein n=1 Tax=Mesorhizobium jarvisii TaxID=1777867 RepID=A0A6M7TM42_9HYPH|nr:MULTISPECIES: hypothetical protein [Mesorhizobium]OBQ68945.1 hypothetical protein A9K72_12200 [Mesorhizobium loti]QKC65909.1 hypothetical protein EB229_29335 [Mesorhizobium jarvisii]QKD11823.1 hypothetical protein EFV37_29345 [Mesorhizobium loti]RJT37930.1 hypothetical protein D3242_01390 [Mesorhizobium jarvisii]
MADDLIERLRDAVTHEGNITFTEYESIVREAADALAAKDKALEELRAELEALKRENKSLSAEIDALEEEGCGVDDDIRKLNTRAEAAESQLEMARKALEPFAREAEVWGGYDETEALVEGWNGGPASQLTVAHLRAAARAQADGETP